MKSFPENMLKEAVIQVLRSIFDPEIPVNIYDLGLIYDIEINDDKIHLTMTLTSPNCPVADSLIDEVRNRILSIDMVSESTITLTFEPAWSPDNLSDEVKLELNLL